MNYIIWQNEHFIFVDKPAGMLSVPARFSDDARPVLGKILEQVLNIQIFPIHRLDFEVSGSMLFAKTAQAHRAASQWFEQKKIQKTYLAISAFNIAKNKILAPQDATLSNAEYCNIFLTQYPVNTLLTWNSLIVKGKKRTFEAPYGKTAQTQATLLDYTQKKEYLFMFWKLSPLTGRSHQLRFELFKRNMPILGDDLYQATQPWIAPHSIALRSIMLNFSAVLPEAAQFGLPLELNAPIHEIDTIFQKKYRQVDDL